MFMCLETSNFAFEGGLTFELFYFYFLKNLN